jgi:hypothetical protein
MTALDATAWAGLGLVVLALLAVAGADTDAGDGNALRSWLPGMRSLNRYGSCVIGALVVLCSRGVGEPLQLLEQPAAAHRLVRRRRRPLRRSVGGRHLLGHRRHLNVNILSLTHSLVTTESENFSSDGNDNFVAMETTRCSGTFGFDET